MLDSWCGKGILFSHYSVLPVFTDFQTSTSAHNSEPLTIIINPQSPYTISSVFLYHSYFSHCSTVAQNQNQQPDKNTAYVKDTEQLPSIFVVQLIHKDISWLLGVFFTFQDTRNKWSLL